MKFVIHFTVSDMSWNYFQYAKESHARLADHPSDLNYKIYSLDPHCSDRARREVGVLEVNELHGLRGSNAHGAALQLAFAHFQPGSVNIISDSDAVMLLKGWDTRVKTELLEEKTDILGITVYEDIGGFSSGTSKFQTYKNLPCLTWMAFSPNQIFTDVPDLSPDKSQPLEIKTQEQSEIYNLPVGYFLMKDIGWRMPSYFRSKKFKLHVLKPHKPSKSAKVLKGLSDYHDEFEIDGKTFLIHQRGSMNHRFRIDPLSKRFYAAADQYLNFPAWSVHPTQVWTNLLNQKWLGRWLRIKEKVHRSFFT